VEAYSTVARSAGQYVAVHGVTRGTDVDDVIAKIDRLLGSGSTARLPVSAIVKK
jgi:hypothetical protein